MKMSRELKQRQLVANSRSFQGETERPHQDCLLSCSKPPLLGLASLLGKWLATLQSALLLEGVVSLLGVHLQMRAHPGIPLKGVTRKLVRTG